MLAHLAGDETLIEAFRRGEDIHDQTSAKVFGPASGMDKHKMRRRGEDDQLRAAVRKTAFTLSKDIGVTPQAAQEFIDAYFSGFPGIRQFIDRTLDEARASGVVEDDLRAAAAGARADQQERPGPRGRGACGGESADSGYGGGYHEAAMIDTHAALTSRPKARMILTVHDELLFEVPGADADELAALVRHHMQSAAALAVPLTVDVGIGENWKEAKG